MTESRNNVWYAIRVTILMVLLVLTLLGWRFVDGLGGPTAILPELVRAHTASEAASAANTQLRIDKANATLLDRERTVADKVSAATVLADIALERKKTFVKNGLSVSYGQVGADFQISNVDNTDLYTTLLALERNVVHKNERLRLETAHVLANLQLNERHTGLVNPMLRVLSDEYSVPIKTYLARALGDIGPPAAPASRELNSLLNEEDPRLLASAAKALAKIGPAAYLPVAESRLLELLRHGDASVRSSSAAALGATTAVHRNSERALREALDDQSPRVRVSAALALADLGWADDDVHDAMADGFYLAPETTLFVEDVERSYEIQRRVVSHFTKLDQVPDSLVPALVGQVTGTQDIHHQEKLVALIANVDSFSEVRANALLDLLETPDVLPDYALKDGLVTLGPDVLPYIEKRQGLDQSVAVDIRRRLEPRTLKSAPVADLGLITRFETTTDAYQRQEIAIEMAESGDRRLLRVLMEHGEERVLNGPIYNVAVDRLVANLRQYGLSATHDEAAKHRALQSLAYLGVLTQIQLEDFRSTAGHPELGNRVRDIWYDLKRSTPQPPSLQQQLASLYGDLGVARNKDIQRIAPNLMSADARLRAEAIDQLEQIASHATEVPPYLLRAMNDPSERVQLKAIDAYVGHGLPSIESMVALTAVLTSTYQSDRLNEQAAVGLAQVGPAALDVLMQATSHESNDVRRAAVFGLWKMGAEAGEARSLLETLSSDPHRGVSTYAQRALDDLGGAR